MTLRFELDPEITPELRAAITDLWTAATNAGGAVGFVAPVERAQVAEAADMALDALTADPEHVDHLLVGYDGEDLAAWLRIIDRRFSLTNHMPTLKGVMVDPEFQGRGYGAELLREAERVVRTLGGVEMLHLTLRGGLGLEQFYGRCGYTEVGRIPRALRVAADDYRDEVHMLLTL